MTVFNGSLIFVAGATDSTGWEGRDIIAEGGTATPVVINDGNFDGYISSQDGGYNTLDTINGEIIINATYYYGANYDMDVNGGSATSADGDVYTGLAVYAFHTNSGTYFGVLDRNDTAEFDAEKTANALTSVVVPSGRVDDDGTTYGDHLKHWNFTLGDNDMFVPMTCFTSGTKIITSKGSLAIDDLCVGDKVLTFDSGFQEIRWIGKRSLTAAELDAQPMLRPIKIAVGALGNGLPETDLVVSRQHRVLLKGELAQSYFGETEVLVAAAKLTDIEGISVETQAETVTYLHLLFDRHEVIFSNSVPTESLYLGPEALRSFSREQKEEIFSLFPEVFEPGFLPAPARTIAPNGKSTRHAAALIVAAAKRESKKTGLLRNKTRSLSSGH